MKTAVIYARYSSDRQTEQSIEGQLRVCNEYAERNDILVIDTYIDRAMTGTNDRRTSFQQMLKDSSKGAWDYVIVYKIDRFGRNKYEIAMNKHTLKLNGIRLLSAMENIPDTPEGIILESLLEGMAEYYSAELSQKVKRGMNESRLKGQYTGGPVVFGYKVEKKKILIDEEQAKVLRYMYEQYAAGVYVKDIIAELTEKGIYYRGEPFKRTTVYNLLRNEKYAGILRHGDEVFTNIYPRIVPEEVFNIVQQKIADNHYGKHVQVKYLLKNKIRCGKCGHSIASDSGTGKSGEIKRYYKCTNRKHNAACDKLPIRKELLEQIVIDVTFKLFENSDNITLLADKVLEEHKKRRDDNSVIILLTKERADIQKAIDNIISCMEQGIVSNSTKKRLDDLEKQLESLNEKILLEKTKAKTQVSKEEIVKYIRTTMKKTPEQILRSLIKEIVLYDDKMEIYYNYADPKRRLDDENRQAFSFYSETFETEIDEHKFKGTPYVLKLEIAAFCK